MVRNTMLLLENDQRISCGFTVGALVFLLPSQGNALVFWSSPCQQSHDLSVSGGYSECDQVSFRRSPSPSPLPPSSLPPHHPHSCHSSSHSCNSIHASFFSLFALSSHLHFIFYSLPLSLSFPLIFSPFRPLLFIPSFNVQLFPYSRYRVLLILLGTKSSTVIPVFRYGSATDPMSVTARCIDPRIWLVRKNYLKTLIIPDHAIHSIPSESAELSRCCSGGARHFSQTQTCR